MPRYCVEFVRENEDGSISINCTTIIPANTESEAKIAVVKMPNVKRVSGAYKVKD